MGSRFWACSFRATKISIGERTIQWTLVTPASAIFWQASAVASSSSFSSGSGIFCQTMFVALSLRMPVGSPVILSLSIMPFPGAGVFAVMLAISNALLFRRHVCAISW